MVGEATYDDHEGSRVAVAAQFEKTGCRRLLVDASASTTQMSVVDDYDFTAQLSDFSRYQATIAMVGNPQEQEQNQFVENVARNRGLNLRLFDNRDDAVHWLRGE